MSSCHRTKWQAISHLNNRARRRSALPAAAIPQRTIPRTLLIQPPLFYLPIQPIKVSHLKVIQLKVTPIKATHLNFNPQVLSIARRKKPSIRCKTPMTSRRFNLKSMIRPNNVSMPLAEKPKIYWRHPKIWSYHPRLKIKVKIRWWSLPMRSVKRQKNWIKTKTYLSNHEKTKSYQSSRHNKCMKESKSQPMWYSMPPSRMRHKWVWVMKRMWACA